MAANGSASGIQRVSDDVGTPYLVIRWAPGVDQVAAMGRMSEAGQPLARPVASPEVQGLDDVRGFPLMAAGALVLAGVIATSHALVVTVRRRRRELGVLSSLGFAPRQRRAVVFAQATTIALVALAIGVPLGMLVGNLVWSAIASSVGVATDSTTPARAIAARVGGRRTRPQPDRDLAGGARQAPAGGRRAPRRVARDQSWMPHSVLPRPAHRPDLGSFGSVGSCVHGWHPMDR